MARRLLNFGQKLDSDPAKDASDGRSGHTRGRLGSRLRGDGERIPSTRNAAALELAQELILGIEHFVLSTPDLDTPGFLGRLRRIAGQISGSSQPEELHAHREWAVQSLTDFGQLQRRYLSEREDELWRLLALYQESQKSQGSANKQFHETIRSVHERLGNVVRLTDLRQARTRLETEIERASSLVIQKTKEDERRAAELAVQVQELEAALVAARDEALRDAMTGVYHRGSFQTQLETMLASDTEFALAIVDIDDFKSINDNLGHVVGDHVLKLAVQLLSKVARPGDVLGRYGGDEFCLLSPGAAPDRLAERLEAVAAPRSIKVHVGERQHFVELSLSVGVSATLTDDTYETLLRRADHAMYEVKRAGKGQARVAAPHRVP